MASAVEAVAVVCLKEVFKFNLELHTQSSLVMVELEHIDQQIMVKIHLHLELLQQVAVVVADTLTDLVILVDLVAVVEDLKVVFLVEVVEHNQEAVECLDLEIMVEILPKQEMVLLLVLLVEVVQEVQLLAYLADLVTEVLEETEEFQI